MQKFQFVTVDTILAKYHRDFRGLGINNDDAIEWIGEALGFIKIASASEEAVAFLEVRNYQAVIPAGLHYIIQIARKNDWHPTSTDCSQEYIQDAIQDTNSEIEVSNYSPSFNLKQSYRNLGTNRYYNSDFTPVRLADDSFFNSLVCSLPEEAEGIYKASIDEYTIVQDNLRFNFKDGYVAVAYSRQMMDCETGYPMVPDDESAKAAITYYLGWKFKEREYFNHREGAGPLADRAEQRWLKYVKQFKNKAKMPTGVDQYQNLADQHRYLVPTKNRYYGFFGRNINSRLNS